MSQATLDSYLDGCATNNEEHRCRYCGRVFKSRKSLNLHLTKKHLDEVIQGGRELVYSGEGVEIEGRGNIVSLKIRARRDLVQDLERVANELRIPLDELVIKALVTATNIDLFPELFDRILRKPSYVS